MKIVDGKRLLPLILCVGLSLASGCQERAEQTAAPPPPEVTVVTVTEQTVPIALEFVGQTEGSRRVEIRSRLSGFLDKRLYEEGSLVAVGQPLFQMDKSEFEAALERAKADLAQQQANWETAKVQLKRCQELFNKNAGTGKDLDNAVGMEQNTKAAVLAAQANLRQAELNLGYTTITSPLKGLSSRTAKQDGSYLTPGPEGLLTYVVQIDPIWVNFSVSENERLKLIAESLEGRLILPEHEKEGEKIEDQLEYVVELVLADGSVFPERGRVKFAEPSFSPETGTFLVRAELANPQELLRPGQFVHVRLLGAKRPKAILVPQRAVMQGARGHFVWAVDAQGKADFTDVEVGDWHGDDWFITSGLKAGMRVVVDGGIKLSSGMPLRIASAPPAPPAKGKSPVAPAPAKPSSRDKQ